MQPTPLSSAHLRGAKDTTSHQDPANPNKGGNLPPELRQFVGSCRQARPASKTVIENLSHLARQDSMKKAINQHTTLRRYLEQQQHLKQLLSANTHAEKVAPGLTDTSMESWMDRLLSSDAAGKISMLSGDTLTQVNDVQQLFLINNLRRHDEQLTPELFTHLCHQLPQLDPAVQHGVSDTLKTHCQSLPVSQKNIYDSARTALIRHSALLEETDKTWLFSDAMETMNTSGNHGSGFLREYLQLHGDFSQGQQQQLFDAAASFEEGRKPVAWRLLAHGCQGFTPARCAEVMDRLLASGINSMNDAFALKEALNTMGTGIRKLSVDHWKALADKAEGMGDLNFILLSTLTPAMDILPSDISSKVSSSILQCPNMQGLMFGLPKLAEHLDKLSLTTQQEVFDKLKGDLIMPGQDINGYPLSPEESNTLNKSQVLSPLLKHYDQLPAEVQDEFFRFVAEMPVSSPLAQMVATKFLPDLAQAAINSSVTEEQWQILAEGISSISDQQAQSEIAQKVSNALHSQFSQDIQQI